MCGHECLVIISYIYLFNMLKNVLFFVMGYLVAMETHVTLF